MATWGPRGAMATTGQRMATPLAPPHSPTHNLRGGKTPLGHRLSKVVGMYSVLFFKSRISSFVICATVPAKAGVSNIRPTGCKRPVPRFNPAREATSQTMQNEEIPRANVIENHEYHVIKNCQHDLVKRDHVIQYICLKCWDKIL